MKKNIAAFALLVMSLCGGALLLGSPHVQAATAGVNNFHITDYRIDYYLSKDRDGRSALKTVESITAAFPFTDQNHGIERAIPSVYDGHQTHMRIAAITDEHGRRLDYSTRDAGGATIARIGDPDIYVHGRQTYKITYTQHDVTRFFPNTDRDEFYWDTTGTGWLVPIDAVAVSVHMPDTLKRQLTETSACYTGRAGSTARDCTIQPTADGYKATATSQLQAHENMTIAVGFQPQTFAAYRPSLAERLTTVWVSSLLVTGAAALALSIWFIIRYNRKNNRTSEMHTIVPEYVPPKGASVSVAAVIARRGGVFAAQLVDLAVRHYLKIYQTREKSWFRQAAYELEIVKDPTDLLPEEREVLQDIFDRPVVGARLDMATLKHNAAVAKKLTDNHSKVEASIIAQYTLRAKDDMQTRWFKRAALISVAAALVTLSPPLLVAALVATICAYVVRPLTDKGVALARYLKGLEMYIKAVETERLRMLQSPEGAEKLPSPIDTNDKRQLVKLYERVLPYAMLLGQEKAWNKQLGQYYESLNQSPEWLVTQNGTLFNAAVFSSAISGLNTVATYADPSSSSAGGSGGGGSSGGGGGGGGGGGW